MDGIFLLLVLIVVYFIPSFIALRRNHKNTMAITMLNLFLGWTFLGWVGALVWSFTHQDTVQTVETKKDLKKEIADFYPNQKKLS